MDLYMDQVIGQLDKYLTPLRTSEAEHLLTPSMVNNYVKLRLLPAPVKKRYSRTHLAYLIVICLLKTVLSIPEVKVLLDAELTETDPHLAYNNLCGAQEKAFAQAVEKAANAADAMTPATLALEMAALAGANKALAQKIIALEPQRL